MMTPQILLLASSSLFILLFHFFQPSLANCTPSACGVIRNISYPFRLKHDHKHCGDRRFELACENDVASLSLNSHKYYVKEINYLNSTIRLVDASINNDTCSFPNSSAYYYNFTTIYSYPYFYLYGIVGWPINLMSCPNPLKNSSLFTNMTYCATFSSSSSHPRFTYVKVGHMNASEVPETCGIDVIVATSWEFKDSNNLSLSEIHHSLLYGFQLRFCGGCKAISKWDKFIGSRYGQFFFFILVIVGLACAGVSPPVFTIIGLAAVSFLLYVALSELSYIRELDELELILLVIVLIVLTPRIIIFPIALCLLIYKFRRRKLSIYNTIESFLRSDNKLMPIRYSYPEIKKMTRGFQDKLGEGGYGSVYKGKLRSGHDVAVKLLGKSGANGKDFINEITTIGRIHHVNIVKLVGYCAQGSKRALIFDFMPNGSLEKYIFNREKGKSLNLDAKFEIAVGVARGIEYLHRGCDVQILHFDIKPHNILLDDKFIPKISDFGLAKSCSTDKTAVTMTAARGTIGYVAPELISRSIGAVSYKADVYSFGMLLMEMVSLKRDLIRNDGHSEQYFPYWIYDCFDQGKDIETKEADENNDNENMRKLARKMTIVALWCIQMSPDDRPPMNKVLEMLEGDVERLQLPDHPSKSSNFVVNVDASGSEITPSTASMPLLNHDNGSSCFEITINIEASPSPSTSFVGIGPRPPSPTTLLRRFCAEVSQRSMELARGWLSYPGPTGMGNYLTSVVVNSKCL